MGLDRRLFGKKIGRFDVNLLSSLLSFLFLFYSNVSIINDSLSKSSIKRTIDWDTKVVYFDIIKPVDEDRFGRVGLDSTSRLVFSVNDLKDTLIRQSLFEMTIDTDNTFKDYFDSDPHLILYFSGLDSILKRGYTKYSEDLKNITVRYELSLFPDFMNLFLSHSKPYRAFYPLTSTGADQFVYTGIIIYAGDDYESSSGGVVKLTDAFFIKIYDENIKLYFDKRMVAPDTLRKWGMLEYTNDVSYKNKNRVGDYPLKLIAKGVYGKNHSDIILDEYSINKIFSNKNNVNLLREGKLVIIK
ncbi:Outer membrane protein [Borrelia nietonii YOR]|uniref:Outer membrane protein n=1 Tax=Borrelia nietonii YOR TaxID=1293576 RepID=A0ABN4C388_9SPIR|nr:Outer membrane protein [Borrelia nietonii YOR]AHH13894.1 Outer membrane protein [Borrelia hermsii MTW]